MSVTVKITVAEPSVIIRSGIIAVIGSAENLKAEIYEVSEIDQLRNVLSWQHPDILLVNPASLGLFPLQQAQEGYGQSRHEMRRTAVCIYRPCRPEKLRRCHIGVRQCRDGERQTRPAGQRTGARQAARIAERTGKGGHRLRGAGYDQQADSRQSSSYRRIRSSPTGATYPPNSASTVRPV